jgi:hypothetical protein
MDVYGVKFESVDIDSEVSQSNDLHSKNKNHVVIPIYFHCSPSRVVKTHA